LLKNLLSFHSQIRTTFNPELAVVKKKLKMAKKKIKLSPGDKLSIFIASIALISAIFTTYIQFFHKTTEFRIGDFDFTHTKDSLNKQLDISVLLINTGTNPVAFSEWYTFFSVDGSMTDGACHNNNIDPGNTSLYTSSCFTRSNIIIEPNTLEYADLKLQISNEKFAEYVKLNQRNESNEPPFIKVGVKMYLIDSNGKGVYKEIIIGAIQFAEYSTVARKYDKSQKELKVY